MSAISALILAAMLSATPEDTAVSPAAVRATIERAVPHIERQGLWWIEEKKCVTCHRVGMMVWSLNAARRRGFEVDDRLDDWIGWATQSSLAPNANGKIDGTTNKEGVAQLLLSGALNSESPDKADAIQRLTTFLVEGQAEDGSWKPDGQLPFQKRPAAETTDVSTYWLALALASQPRSDVVQRSLDAAIERVAQSPPGVSTESYVARLLLAHKLQNDALITQSIADLRRLQQPDGGWGWLTAGGSDALATGMSLYALSVAGVDCHDPAINRARQFLTTTQREDGAWDVRGTKTRKQDSIEETAVYWGTCWAVLGLVESLPD